MTTVVHMCCPRCHSLNIRENVCLICAYPITTKGGSEGAIARHDSSRKSDKASV